MRRDDKEITSREKIDNIIMRSQVCRLAFAVENDPYMIPLSFGYDGSSIFFHTAKTGKKIDYIETNHKVCFEFEGNVRLLTDKEKACKCTFSFESVIGYGVVSELLSKDKKEYALNQIMLRYTGKKWTFEPLLFLKTRVWQISITSLSGKHTKNLCKSKSI